MLHVDNFSQNCCSWSKVCHDLDPRSYLQGQGHNSCRTKIHVTRHDDIEVAGWIVGAVFKTVGKILGRCKYFDMTTVICGLIYLALLLTVVYEWAYIPFTAMEYWTLMVWGLAVPKFIMLVVTFYSDGVLNPNGVRFGSAEIYNVGNYLLQRWSIEP